MDPTKLILPYPKRYPSNQISIFKKKLKSQTIDENHYFDTKSQPNLKIFQHNNREPTTTEKRHNKKSQEVTPPNLS